MRYRTMPGGRLLLGAQAALFAVAAVALTVATVTGGDDAPPAWFSSWWIAGFLWNAYWWFHRIAVELRLDDRQLSIVSVTQTRRVALRAVVAIRPARWLPGVMVIEIEGQRPAMCTTMKGFGTFVDAITALRPDLPVRLGRIARFVERMPGRSRTMTE